MAESLKTITAFAKGSIIGAWQCSKNILLDYLKMIRTMSIKFKNTFSSIPTCKWKRILLKNLETLSIRFLKFSEQVFREKIEVGLSSYLSFRWFLWHKVWAKSLAACSLVNKEIRQVADEIFWSISKWFYKPVDSAITKWQKKWKEFPENKFTCVYSGFSDLVLYRNRTGV